MDHNDMKDEGLPVVKELTARDLARIKSMERRGIRHKMDLKVSQIMMLDLLLEDSAPGRNKLSVPWIRDLDIGQRMGTRADFDELVERVRSIVEAVKYDYKLQELDLRKAAQSNDFTTADASKDIEDQLAIMGWEGGM